ncbi:conserved protein, unknown function [Plasmodium chabaudi chabaudi]|uniref:Uncharacterized protein n=1 Tax=Plasmodium chabaudi chabaudi TaxID=31271 RepID=A0A4V6M9A8_PLACU|nr:conserved protein, unknown function [Plasmodium chabaudi chabaudi]VTZ68759.1 conserved protein, unknown function [Plasmodium chabaudi chabaudi]|eukprot:XP_016655354.1 conserved Plasmodium protein, unknown function [Plasmodium chabaudi chabaudi]
MGVLFLYICLLKALVLFSYYAHCNYNIKIQKLTFESKTEECKKEVELFGENDMFLIKNNSNIYLQIQDNNTVISNLNVYGTIHTNDYLFSQKSQWKLYHIDTFDKKDNKWVPSDISTCGNSPDTFLGGPCKFGAIEAYTKITNIPKHDELKIKMRIHFFDTWDGDSLFLQVDDQIIWTESHKSNDTTSTLLGIDVCGKNTPDRLSVPIDAEFEHSADSMSILLGSTLKKTTDSCVTSWGIDDLIIYYK